MLRREYIQARPATQQFVWLPFERQGLVLPLVYRDLASAEL
jgi:hypothetical protein